ncbi:MAG: hypothetical protein E7370_06385 [Clostridiales bacterium]|nr:hypothetical protein [Clostridiales bacterium]
MDKIMLLQARKKQILEAGNKIREDINALIDKDSFVEFSVFSFSKNDFYGKDAEGEGVVTGFATIEGYPFYIIAQNGEVLSGGVSKANCQKMAKCIEQAEKSQTPILYMLNSQGVQIGEGVNVLEGLATLLLKASQLKGTIPQYLIVNGEVFGQLAILAGICDFNFFIKNKSILAANSPLVVSAKDGISLTRLAVGGSRGQRKSQLSTFHVDDYAEIKDKILKITNLLAVSEIDCDELNKVIPSLNSEITHEGLLEIFDSDSYMELGVNFYPMTKTYLGRIGGITCAVILFEVGDGVFLKAKNVRKLKDFAEFASCYNLPLITLVNTQGVLPNLNEHDSLIIKEIGEYISILDCIDTAKISVVYGKAIGLGYTLFASKSMGYDYTYAFATAKIALFDSVQGAEIEFADYYGDKEALAQRYADENSDPINAAKGGYIDNVIEPQFVKQYLIASLQMLVK